MFCNSCARHLTAGDFYKDKSHANGLGSTCKECVKKRVEIYRNKNIDVIRNKKSEYRDKNKKQLAEKDRRYYENNKETIKNRSQAWASKNRPKYLARLKAYHIAHADQHKSDAAQRYKADVDNQRALRKKHYSENKAEIQRYGRLWRQSHGKRYYRENIGKLRAAANAYRALRINATPSWADLKKIKTVYEKAAALEISDGVKRHVDHAVPLKGRNVCGLHVHYNLQILTATENMSKGNR